MPAKKAAPKRTSKSAAIKNLKPSPKKSPGYIRELEVKYKRKKVKDRKLLNEPLTNPQKIVELFGDLQDETKEKLICISLDAQQKILCYEVVAIGSIDSIVLKPIEAIWGCLVWRPAGFVIIHNHPTGDPTPSTADKQFTFNLSVMVNHHMGLKLFDHIIIGELGKYYSFAEHGEL